MHTPNGHIQGEEAETKTWPSAVREEGRGMSGPIRTGHLTMWSRKASIKGYMGAGAWSMSRSLPSGRKDVGVLVRVHKMHKVPVRSKAMVPRRTERTVLQIRPGDRMGPGGFLFTAGENVDFVLRPTNSWQRCWKTREHVINVNVINYGSLKRKNITKENWAEKSEMVNSCAEFLSFQSKKSIGTSKNQSENSGHLYCSGIKGNCWKWR